jgi:hypothetical protein
MKVSAPVMDEKFYSDFIAHQITITHGDALRVKFKIRQKRASNGGICINQSYEVVELLNHMPRASQRSLIDQP